MERNFCLWGVFWEDFSDDIFRVSLLRDNFPWGIFRGVVSVPRGISSVGEFSGKDVLGGKSRPRTDARQEHQTRTQVKYPKLLTKTHRLFYEMVQIYYIN